MKTMRGRLRVFLLFAALTASAGYALAGEDEAKNCCAKADDCREVDSKANCSVDAPCTGETYKHCCSSACGSDLE